MGKAPYEAAHNEHINRYKMAHMIGVAEYMRERAEAYDLDGDVMYAVGLLHDIGYIGGRMGHEEYGEFLLSKIGIDEDIAFAVQHHGENLHEIKEAYGESCITPEFVLLMEADASVDARGYRVGFSGRLNDIADRYGKEHIAYKTVSDNIAFIKDYQFKHEIGKPVNLYHKKERHRSEGDMSYDVR